MVGKMKEYMREVVEEHRDSATGEINCTTLAEDTIWHLNLEGTDYEEYAYDLAYDVSEEYSLTDVVSGGYC